MRGVDNSEHQRLTVAIEGSNSSGSGGLQSRLVVGAIGNS